MTTRPGPSAATTALADVRRLVADFEAAAIERLHWTHEAHVTVAVWYLLTCEPGDALARVRSGIQRLNAARGVPQTATGGYHETLTRVYMILAAQALEASGAPGQVAEAVRGVVARLPDRELPLQFYSRETLMSWAARSGWVEPDVAPIALPSPE